MPRRCQVVRRWHLRGGGVPAGWRLRDLVRGSGDMDYQQNWATRAADGTVTERGFCGREYAVEDCWEQFGITRKRYAELIAVERVREVAEEKTRSPLNIQWEEETDTGWVQIVVWAREPERTSRLATGEGVGIYTAALATIQALGGGE